MADRRGVVVAIGAAVLMDMMDQAEAEEEEVLMAAARLAVMEIMDIEEGEVVDVDGHLWEPVTVVINDYHYMGDAAFRLHFRMSRIVFERVCHRVHDHLHERGRIRRNRTPFEDIMLMVIWLLATPDTFRSVALRFGVVPSTLYYFYTYIVEALRELSAQVINWPTPAEKNQIKAGFLAVSGFPGIIGSIDCTHVYITAPVEHAQQYVNRHHSYSINVQVVVDNTLLVRHVHVGEVGSMNDRRVFRRSSLYEGFLRGGDLITPDEHLVGDGGYTLTNFMMIPFAHHGNLTPQQRNYNRRLSQARVRVENAFARAKGKWRRLKFLAARNQQNVVDHITASFTLHNLIIMNGERVMEDDELLRPINAREILGAGNNEEDEGEDGDQDLEHLIADAEDLGREKRLLLMDGLPMPE